jgi:hypothetical protein
MADLDAIAVACHDAPDTGTCVSAFTVLAATNPACATCLSPFNAPFNEFRGVYLCAAPLVSAACNHATGCEIDCQDTSCNQCPAGSGDQCRNQVNAGGGQCRTYVNQTMCVAPAVNPGTLCSPATYIGPLPNPQPVFGNWLRAVGDHFCGNGP